MAMGTNYHCDERAVALRRMRSDDAKFNEIICAQPFDFEDSEKSKRAPIVRWRYGYPVVPMSQSSLVR
jgi:hypothetical protein